MFATVAHAAGTAPAAGQGFMSFVPLILIFVVFYFLLIRPQQKKAKEHQDFLNSLKKGDTVLSSGGIQGVITGLTDSVVTLEIADNVRVKVARPYILGKAGAAGKDEAACASKSGG